MDGRSCSCWLVLVHLGLALAGYVDACSGDCCGGGDGDKAVPFGASGTCFLDRCLTAP